MYHFRTGAICLGGGASALGHNIPLRLLGKDASTFRTIFPPIGDVCNISVLMFTSGNSLKTTSKFFSERG